jgi:hypothetical protein
MWIPPTSGLIVLFRPGTRIHPVGAATRKPAVVPMLDAVTENHE